MARHQIAEFGVIQKLLAFAQVAVYVADDNGESTGVLASLYQAASGPALLANPQVLDTDGKLAVECWVDSAVMAEISNISERTERGIQKIRVNPLQYPLPLTTASVIGANVQVSVDEAEAAATTATAQAGISTTNATQTAADRVQTGLDRAQTGLDVVTTGNNATNAGISETNAAASAVIAAAAAAGMNWRKVRASTTAALPSCTYSNGSGGVGANLLATANGAFPAQDGVTLALNDRIVVRSQAAPLQNGVYYLSQLGSGGTPWRLTRATDSDSWTELVSQVVIVEEGTDNKELAYICTVNAGGTIGTTSVTWDIWNMPLADGAVSTAAKIANGIITFAKILASEFASIADILGNFPSKFVSAQTLFPLYHLTSVRKAALQGIVNNTATALIWDTEDVDSGGWHDNATNNTRITVDFTGYVQLTGSCFLGSSGAVQARLYLHKNGSRVSQQTILYSGGGEVSLNISDIISCAPGDYFELVVYQNSGGTLNTDQNFTRFSAMRVR